MDPRAAPSAELARTITRGASRQTALTIALLVDRPSVDDAYRAYAYFRWVDDQLDRENLSPPARRAFLARQARLLEAAYTGGAVDACPEERILLDLVLHGSNPGDGLGCYLHRMMEVMAFDAERRGRTVSEAALAGYTHALAVAATEALHHFIGRGRGAPAGPSRYQAACGAHIAHMLRDFTEDLAIGYINVPNEILQDRPWQALKPEAPWFRDWVRSRVFQARRCLEDGRTYLASVATFRCRVAGLAYILTFERILRAIERAGFVLRPELGAADPPRPAPILSRALLAAALPPSTPSPRRSTAIPHAASPPAELTQ